MKAIATGHGDDKPAVEVEDLEAAAKKPAKTKKPAAPRKPKAKVEPAAEPAAETKTD